VIVVENKVLFSVGFLTENKVIFGGKEWLKISTSYF
jgi:hypothetical protein